MPDPAESTPESPPAADEPAAPTPEPSRRARSFDVRAFVTQNPRLVGAAALLVLGIVFVMLGWYGSATTNILTEQIPYLVSGGLLGLGLIIVAGFLASSAMVEQKTDQMRRELLQALEFLPSEGASTNGSAKGTPAAGTVYVLPNGHSYHLTGCPVIEGKEGVSTSTARAAVAAGLDMCKLCGPE